MADEYSQRNSTLKALSLLRGYCVVAHSSSRASPFFRDPFQGLDSHRRSARGNFPQRQAPAYKRGLPAQNFDSGLIALIGEHVFLF